MSCKVLVNDRGVPCSCAVKVPSQRPQYFYASGSTEKLQRCAANYYCRMSPSPVLHLIVGELPPEVLPELTDWTPIAVLGYMDMKAYRGASGRHATREVTQLVILPPGPCRIGWILEQIRIQNMGHGKESRRKARAKKPGKARC